jgi:hypothetical protein
MKKLAWTVVLVALACAGAGGARSEVFSQAYSVGPWNSDVVAHYYVDIPVDLGFGVAEVDSIWIEITGVSHIGSWYLDLGMDLGTMVSCRDVLFASFLSEPSQGDCGESYVAPDGIADCIAGTYTTSGATNTTFNADVYFSGVEWSRSYPLAFAVVVPRPGLGDLFRDGMATLRIEEIDGGGHFTPCDGGLADIESVRVNVAFDPALPVESASWGSLKASYRY